VKTLAHETSRAEISRRLRTVRPDAERRWGRMSAHQMVCHLGDAFRMALGQKAVSQASGPLQRTIVKWFALYVPLPWPPGIPTRPEVDPFREGTAPDEFAADVTQLEAIVEMFTSETRSLDRQVHPIFGSLSDAAWLRWGYRHMDHHLRQFGA
jgi:hypothetical protein